jgi:hypothetical protein
MSCGREEAENSHRMFAGAANRALAIAALAACLAMSACSDEPTPGAATPQPVEETKPAWHRLGWLRLTDGIAPEQWLASREADSDLALDDPAVADMRRVLDVASSRFRDLPRMIANRAVQLETMLKEKSIDERAPRIIVTLSDVPGRTRYVESFAGLTQQYYNLRVDGLTRAQAIDVLKQQFDRRPAERGSP